MERQKVDMYLMSNSKYLPETHVPMIRERLLNADDDRASMLYMLEYKDPTTALMLAVLPSWCGIAGIGRFYIGDTGQGIGQLLTCGGCGIWAIIDWFLIMGATREKNMEKLQMML